MTWIFPVALLLIGMTDSMPEHLSQELDNDVIYGRTVMTSLKEATTVEEQNGDPEEQQAQSSAADETHVHEDTSGKNVVQKALPGEVRDADLSMGTTPRLENPPVNEFSNHEPIDPTFEPPIESLPPNEAVEPITLDELLRQAKTTQHLQQEAQLSRLEQRRRLAVALRTTLEAAAQVAEFGDAGAELLEDASLDTIVATMIADREREDRKLAAPEALTQSRVTVTPLSEAAAAPNPRRFDAWRLVYIVRDARGHRVGWSHRLNGERATTAVGETKVFGDDAVTIVGDSSDERGRFLIVDVNGVRREIHLF